MRSMLPPRRDPPAPISPRTTHALNDAIAAYSAAGAPDKAGALFEYFFAEERGARPNAAAYLQMARANALWVTSLSSGRGSRGRGWEAAEEAERFLREAERCSRSPSAVKINGAFYNDVIQAWTGLGTAKSVRRADAVLNRLVGVYESDLSDRREEGEGVGVG